MRLSLLGVALFGSGAYSLALQKRFPASTYAVKESHFVPRSWTRVASAPTDHTIYLRIGLTQGRFDELEKSLYEGEPKLSLCRYFFVNYNWYQWVLVEPISWRNH